MARTVELTGACAQAGKLLQQLCYSFELSKEPPSKTGSRLSLVEPNGQRQVLRREPVD
jgi:hypothetical protein